MKRALTLLSFLISLGFSNFVARCHATIQTLSHAKNFALSIIIPLTVIRFMYSSNRSYKIRIRPICGCKHGLKYQIGTPTLLVLDDS
jgi:hypothetical protein